MTRAQGDPPGTLLADGTVVGGWWSTTASDRLLCELCPRACELKPGDRGFCFVRENRDGQMVLSTYGRSTGFCIDPIEKKPLNHFYPGSSVLSFGTAGCNLGCKFCQNWDISKSREIERLSEEASPEAIALAARETGCQSVAFTYNDPVVWAEYAIDTAIACHREGIRTVAVTAGYIEPAARPAFFRHLDAANVDLKGFTESFYQQLTLSHLQPVLETLQWLRRETDVWLEITNLIIPQANDDGIELRQMCDWIVEHLGPATPVHFTAFHPDFRLRDRPATPLETLIAAHETARQAGLQFVYTGNVHDASRQTTYCPSCQRVLIERDWYQLGEYQLDLDRCRHCGTQIPGRFAAAPGTWGPRRQPVRMAPYVRRASSQGQPRSTAGSKEMTDSTSTDASPTTTQRPELSSEQHDALQREACRVVAAAVTGVPSEAAPSFSDLQGRCVEGAFVTLKRGGQLRGCCGVLGRYDLLEAMRTAAQRTATSDHRLPPISPTELSHLTLDVSLLFGFQPLTGSAEENLAAVQVGRHGLQIRSGQQAGLLLPVVATEQGWTAEQFLAAVCRKAGLDTATWRQPSAVVHTFEAEYFGGPWSLPNADQPLGLRPFLTREDAAKLAAHCHHNLAAQMQGGTPSYYCPDCPDGTAQGVALQIDGDFDGPVEIVQLSLRPGVPLQATLVQLTERLATGLRAPPGATRLFVFLDPALHGTVASSDLNGVDTQTRAIVVAEDSRIAWRWQPGGSAEELLQQAIADLDVWQPDAALVYSLQVVSGTPAGHGCTSPRPQTGLDERPAAVAGSFYPADPERLDALLDRLLNGVAPPSKSYRAALVPHAGLVYSGAVAAEVYRRLEYPRRILVIGPKHTRDGVPWAIAPHRTWCLPGGRLPADVELAQQLAARIPRLRLDAAAHAREHGIELQLPFLARLAPRSLVTGIALGQGNWQSCSDLGQQLAAVLRELDELPLLLISSDMNHFAADAENRRRDALALTALRAGDAQELFNVVRKNDISMCGVLPAVTVLTALQALGGPVLGEQVAYATSGDVSGDLSRVVGYAGMLFE